MNAVHNETLNRIEISADGEDRGIALSLEQAHKLREELTKAITKAEYANKLKTLSQVADPVASLLRSATRRPVTLHDIWKGEGKRLEEK